MKTLLTAILTLMVTGVHAVDFNGTFKFKKVPVSQILDIYAKLTDKQLIIEPAVTNQTTWINLETHKAVRNQEAAQLIETALREQANVVIAPLDDKSVTVKLVGFTAYSVRAGGLHTFVPLTNAPSSNHVSISLATGRDDGTLFVITNGEPHTILLWNVRVQVKSKGKGTDGFGWDTVHDDYPTTTAKFNSSLYPPGSTGEFTVHHLGETPWRVCVLYSIDWKDSGKGASGNYEVISNVFDE